jgi:hypothetical protein
MITPDRFLGPISPVESAGLEFFKVKIEGFVHGALVAWSISRPLNKSKCQEGFNSAQTENGMATYFSLTSGQNWRVSGS